MTTLWSKTSVAYPVQATLLNLSARKRRWLIDNARTMVGFPIVCRTEDGIKEEGGADDEEMSMYGIISYIGMSLESVARVGADSERRERQQGVLGDAMKVVWWHLWRHELSAFFGKSTEVVAWRWVLILIS